MYLRWKTIRRRPRWCGNQGQDTVLTTRDGREYPVGKDGVTVYAAQIVESCRVDGKPRQRIVAHLGSIPEHLVDDTITRVFFWELLYRRLARAQLPKEQRQTVIDKLSERVKPPSTEEREKVMRDRVHPHETRYWIWTGSEFRVASRREKRERTVVPTSATSTQL